MKLSLKLPVQGFISQNFGDNAVSYYGNGGLAGHPGTDLCSKYDDPIIDPIIGFNKKYIYSTLNKNNPDLMRYRAVRMIVEADCGVYEVVTGHCNQITCEPGLLNGQQIATEGNTGDVFVNGKEVTAEAKNAGSHAGFHVHFQVRRLRKVKQSTLHSLTGDNGSDFVDEEGYHFDVPNFDNGYNGCIDAMQFVGVQNNYKFTRDLSMFSINRDVLELQKRLVKLGFANFTPTGFFGSKTRQAVIDYQMENHIAPSTGYCGVLTRGSLNT